MNKIYAIHQPDFMPWLGFFNKLAKVDALIIFDSVSIATGKSWSTRVKICSNGKDNWLSLPIIKSGNMGAKICKVEIFNPSKSFKSIRGKIINSYRNAPYFKEIFPQIDTLLSSDFTLLSEFNTTFIIIISRLLFGESKEFILSSSSKDLMTSEQTKTEYIIETCLAFGVKNYISGTGCLSFLNKKQFEENEIKISFETYNPKPYSQFSSGFFLEGLSVMDALMNIGVKETLSLLNK